jgi:hypothetical protein
MVHIRRMSRLCFGSQHSTIAFRGSIALDQPILLLLLLLLSSSLLSPLCRVFTFIIIIVVITFILASNRLSHKVVFYNILSFGEDSTIGKRIPMFDVLHKSCVH